MKGYFDDRQNLHMPQYFMASGAISENPEKQERVDILTEGALAADVAFSAPRDAGILTISKLHSPEYLTFLQTIYERWQRIPGSGSEVVPNVHPMSRTDSYPKAATGQAGYHQADTACPIGEHTWEAVYWSAQCAISAADDVLAGDRAVYAFSRPPGHHAFGDLAGGFCFLNNSGIAAQRLLDAGRRPAILDVDVHHGNGTQGIFYNRDDVLTVSLHANPERFYPFFWGHAQERGEGAGRGYNVNYPLARHTGDDEYMDVLEDALKRIENFGADVIVVALGLDASIDDPFQGLAITQAGFERIGARIAATGLPLVLVQEGGYICDSLGKNLTRVLGGVQSKA